MCLDVTITDGTEMARRGRPWRFVQQRRERKKHLRYPGPDLRRAARDLRTAKARRDEAAEELRAREHA